MKFAQVEWQEEWRGYWLDPRPYLAELEKFAQDLPSGARSFACDREHYDFGSGHCVKDLLLAAVSMPAGERRTLEISFAPNSSKHLVGLRLRYFGVVHFSIDQSSGVAGGADTDSLLIDEILPAEQGCTHELALTGARITVVCSDLEAAWGAPAGQEASQDRGD